MKTPLTPKPDVLLQQITQIQRMERGKLRVMRQGAEGPYFHLQSWENGRNFNRYVPREQLPAYQEALAGYEKFRQLSQQYAEQIIARTRAELAGSKKKEPTPPAIQLARDEEIQRLIAQFQSQTAAPEAVAQLEVLVRTAVFKSANDLVGWMLQQAADRIDAADQPKPGEVRKGREAIRAQGMFGSFPLARDYYYHPGKKQGHYPADDALGLEVCYTPALAKLICLEGADEPTDLKAERHLEKTGGISVSARQIQRVIQRVGASAQAWQEREATPGPCDAPLLYASGDGTGVPMMPEELKGRKGKQADGTATTRQAYLGCVFTQHRVDEKGHPVRDYQSTTHVSSFQSIDQFGPLLRQEAIRRGMGSAGKVVLLIDGAKGLENMGKDCFKDCVQIVDFYHAVEHAGLVLAARIGKDHPDYKKRQRRWAKRLLKDKVQNLIDETRQECAGKPQAAEVEKTLGYFVRNVSRMQHGTFRSKGYFIGSGVVEANPVLNGAGQFFKRGGKIIMAKMKICDCAALTRLQNCIPTRLRSFATSEALICGQK